MSLVQNQFSQSVVKGLVDLRMSNNTVACRVKSDEATALVAGQAVKLVDSAGGVPEVTAIESDTDAVFGYVNYNLKQSSFEAGEAVEISLEQNAIYLEASEAIARGASVMPVVSGNKVATATAGKSVIGWAFDKASGSGSLIRVVLEKSEIPYVDTIVPTDDIADLDQDISAAYVEAEVQAISDKVDAVLGALRTAGILV